VNAQDKARQYLREHAYDYIPANMQDVDEILSCRYGVVFIFPNDHYLYLPCIGDEDWDTTDPEPLCADEAFQAGVLPKAMYDAILKEHNERNTQQQEELDGKRFRALAAQLGPDKVRALLDE
jgi:hypothetical protein